MNLFPKKDIYKVKSVPLDPESISNPTTASDYHSRGFAYYGCKKYELAVEDLEHAISLDANLVDAYYSLGMVLKAIDRKEESKAAFQKVVDLTKLDNGSERVRANMLRRLALGHMNLLTQGDWNLEKEIWKHTE